MKHTRKKTKGMKRHMFMLPVLLVAVVALILGASAPGVWADDDDDGDEIPFDETKIIFEVNATDGDAGVQVFVDGEGWKELEIEGPNGRKQLDVEAKRSIGQQGITEFFFESAEPSFDEQSLEELLELFPEGEYEFEGETVEGDELEGEATLSHVIPCGPVVSVSQPDSSVIIGWVQVDGVFDPEDDVDGCDSGGEEAEIDAYQVIVEGEDGDLDITLSADAMSVTLPPEFALGDRNKFEVLAIADNGNQTITEDEFCLDDGGLLEECPEEPEV